MFCTRSRIELGSVFSEYLRSFGKRYLASRPGLLFSRSIVRFFYGVATFGWKNQKKRFPPIHRRFIRNWGPFFRKKRVRNWFWGNQSVPFFFSINDILQKWHAPLDASPDMAGGTPRKNGRDSPVTRVKHACEGVETSIFSFYNLFAVRSDLRRYFRFSTTERCICLILSGGQQRPKRRQRQQLAYKLTTVTHVSTRDRSIPLSLQKWVSTKSSISQLTFSVLYYILLRELVL